MMGLRMVLSHAASIGVRFSYRVGHNRQGILAVSQPGTGKVVGPWMEGRLRSLLGIADDIGGPLHQSL